MSFTFHEAATYHLSLHNCEVNDCPFKKVGCGFFSRCVKIICIEYAKIIIGCVSFRSLVYTSHLWSSAMST